MERLDGRNFNRSSKPPAEAESGVEQILEGENEIGLFRQSGRYFYLRAGGERIGDSYEWASGFFQGRAWVRDAGVYTLIDTGGKRLTNENIVERWSPEDGFSRVRMADGTYNFVRYLDGGLLSPRRLERANDFYKGRAIVRVAGRRWVLTPDGKLREWTG